MITACYTHHTVGQKKKGKKPGSGSSTSSSSRSDTPTKGIETADKTVADAAKKLKDMSSPGKNMNYSKFCKIEINRPCDMAFFPNLRQTRYFHMNIC